MKRKMEKQWKQEYSQLFHRNKGVMDMNLEEYIQFKLKETEEDVYDQNDTLRR